MLSPPPSLSEISPELVLVDPELRPLALAQLPEIVLWVPERPPTASPSTGTRWAGRTGLLALRIALVACVTAGALFVVDLRNDGPAPSRQSSPTRRPTDVVRVTTRLDHPGLHWVRVASASYYNVVLWRGHRRVLDLWPTATHVLLPRSWSRGGARGSLVPGRYVWFVYPGIGSKPAAHYGTPVQRGVLIVNGSGGNR